MAQQYVKFHCTAILLTILLELSTGPAFATRNATLDLGTGNCAGAPSDCGTYSPTSTCSALPLTQLTYRGRTIFRWLSNLSVVKARLELGSSFQSAQHAAETAMPQKFVLGNYTPHWSFSGAWLENDDTVLLPDFPSKSFYDLALSRNILRQIQAYPLSGGLPYLPKRIEKDSSGGFVVELADGHFAWVNERYQVVRERMIINAGDPDKGYIGAIWSWSQYSGHLAAIADVKPTGRNWYTAIILLNSNNPSAFQVVEKIDLKSQTRQYARLGLPLLAYTRRGAFILKMDKEPGVYQLGLGEEFHRLREFPIGFSEPPDIENEIPRNAVSSIYQKLEQKATPIGLVSRGGRLFIILRRPNVDRIGTLWQVVSISDDEKLGRIVNLPTSGSDILLLPGRTSWVIVEKHRVNKLFDQPVIDVKKVENLFSGNNEETSKVERGRR